MREDLATTRHGRGARIASLELTMSLNRRAAFIGACNQHEDDGERNYDHKNLGQCSIGIHGSLQPNFAPPSRSQLFDHSVKYSEFRGAV